MAAALLLPCLVLAIVCGVLGPVRALPVTEPLLDTGDIAMHTDVTKLSASCRSLCLGLVMMQKAQYGGCARECPVCSGMDAVGERYRDVFSGLDKSCEGFCRSMESNPLTEHDCMRRCPSTWCTKVNHLPYSTAATTVTETVSEGPTEPVKPTDALEEKPESKGISVSQILWVVGAIGVTAFILLALVKTMCSRRSKYRFSPASSADSIKKEDNDSNIPMIGGDVRRDSDPRLPIPDITPHDPGMMQC